MNLLLDTHTFVWALLSPHLLGPEARQRIGEPSAKRFVSAASLYEMSLRASLGRWPEATRVLEQLDRVVHQGGYTLIPVQPAHAVRAGRLSAEHRDPFDRLLAATALQDDYDLCSADPAMDTFGVRRIW